MIIVQAMPPCGTSAQRTARSLTRAVMVEVAWTGVPSMPALVSVHMGSYSGVSLFCSPLHSPLLLGYISSAMDSQPGKSISFCGVHTSNLAWQLNPTSGPSWIPTILGRQWNCFYAGLSTGCVCCDISRAVGASIVSYAQPRGQVSNTRWIQDCGC